MQKDAFPAIAFAGTFLLYLSGMFIPIMEVDAAQYASISMELLQQDEYLQIRHRGMDYLDKPPLLFWLGALSISVFGPTSFAYKFPSVLALILGVYSTYRFARLYYPEQTARATALILATSLSAFLMANDCRTDNLLLGFSGLAIWKGAAYLKTSRLPDLVIASIGVGLAMLAKGPLGFVFPLLALGPHMVIRCPKRFGDLYGLIVLPIVGLVLSPMLLGLYRQYGWEGFQFYFWTQSFGRITGDSSWTNNTGPFFFVHTFLWSFLPFTFFFLPALFRYLVFFFSRKKEAGPPEWISLGGFLLTFVALSLSRYKLPHYIYLVSPMAAVMTAWFWMEVFGKMNISIVLLRTQWVLMGVLVLGVPAFSFWVWQDFPWTWLGAMILYGAYWWANRNKQKDSWPLSFRATVLSGLLVGAVLNLHFYPRLLTYQAPSEAAFYLAEEGVSPEEVIAYKKYGHTLSYYLGGVVPFLYAPEQVNSILQSDQEVWVFTQDEGRSDLEKLEVLVESDTSFSHFPVAKLNLPFLNPRTRPQKTEKMHLLRVKTEKPVKKE